MLKRQRSEYELRDAKDQAKEAQAECILELYKLRETKDPVAITRCPEVLVLETCLGLPRGVVSCSGLWWC